MMKKSGPRWCSLALGGAILAGAVLAPPPSGALAQGVVERVLERGSIVIGTREAAVPYAYIDAGGNWVGWAMDLNKALHEIIATKLGAELDIEFKPVTAQTRIPLIVNGSLDWVLGTTGQTVKREEVVDFALVHNAVCVKKLVGIDSGIETTEDLAGKRVGVNQGSVEERLIAAMNASGELSPPAEVITFDKHSSGFIALSQGKTDAHVTLDDTLIGLMIRSPEPEAWAVRGPDIFCINSGIILPENDSDWRDMVNGALCYFIATGGYDALYAEWFLGDQPKAGYRRVLSEPLRNLIHGQCPFGSETFLDSSD